MSWPEPIESIVSCEGDSLDALISDVEQSLPPVVGRTWVVRNVDARHNLIDVSPMGGSSWLPGQWHTTVTAVALPDKDPA